MDVSPSCHPQLVSTIEMVKDQVTQKVPHLYLHNNMRSIVHPHPPYPPHWLQLLFNPKDEVGLIVFGSDGEFSIPL